MITLDTTTRFGRATYITPSCLCGRFICISDDENIWKYERPAVDALEPSIDLSTEGFVLFHPNIGFGDKNVEKISYEDFIAKLKLDK